MDDIQRLEESAKLAEQAERYDDMCDAMKKLVNATDKLLEKSQRDLFSVAFKNVVGSRRSAWRIINVQYEKKEDSAIAGILKDYKSQIVKELEDICNDVIKIIDEKLVPKAKLDDGETDEEKTKVVNEAKVFYLKMKGDYYRYLTEVKSPDDREECAKQSGEAYEEAYKEVLPSTHPIRLGLALNYSVYFYEIANLPDKACEIAKKAFDEAMDEIDNLKDSSYKDSTLIMQLLRDNLTLWTSSDQEENEN